MKNAIHGDLRRIQRREFHLWFLTLSLLVLFGAVVAARYSLILLGRDPDSGLTRATAYKVGLGLFFLVALFCLHAVHTLLINARLKGLLTELNSVAASSMALEDFLPSIARQIAATNSVTSCKIALFRHGRAELDVTCAYARGGANREDSIEQTYSLADLSVSARALEDGRPLVLNRREVERLPADGKDAELLSAGSESLQSVLIVPMATSDRILGLVILGRSRGLRESRFGASTIAVVQALAKHAATAIDQAQLKREAIHDPLTNLYNRRHFTQRLREEIIRADRDDHLTAILLCDLDGFKAVNDTLGHQVGDDVLRTVAESIQASTRGTDLVFRWGGDEIVVILSKSTREGMLSVANRIREGVRQATAARRTAIDVSIGIGLYPEHGRNEDDLIRTADRALYIAKKSGDKVRVGEEDYELDRGSIKVVWQPVVDVSSDAVVGHEALARDPHGKLTSFELFDKYRAIGRLKELKQLTLTSQIQAAREIGLKRVFVNVDFGVLSQLDPIPKPPGTNVVLELSEREALHDLDNHLTVARKWRAEGYQFAIDDFGAGFISLPFLAMLVPEYVKVDRSTMLQAVASEKFKGFLGSLLQAVRAYATAGIIAEGIEEKRELRLVKELGMTLAQGYMFGRPGEVVEADLAVRRSS